MCCVCAGSCVVYVYVFGSCVVYVYGSCVVYVYPEQLGSCLVYVPCFLVYVSCSCARVYVSCCYTRRQLTCLWFVPDNHLDPCPTLSYTPRIRATEF